MGKPEDELREKVEWAIEQMEKTQQEKEWVIEEMEKIIQERKRLEEEKEWVIEQMEKIIQERKRLEEEKEWVIEEAKKHQEKIDQILKDNDKLRNDLEAARKLLAVQNTKLALYESLNTSSSKPSSHNQEREH